MSTKSIIRKYLFLRYTDLWLFVFFTSGLTPINKRTINKVSWFINSSSSFQNNFFLIEIQISFLISFVNSFLFSFLLLFILFFNRFFVTNFVSTFMFTLFSYLTFFLFLNINFKLLCYWIFFCSHAAVLFDFLYCFCIFFCVSSTLMRLLSLKFNFRHTNKLKKKIKWMKTCCNELWPFFTLQNLHRFCSISNLFHFQFQSLK